MTFFILIFLVIFLIPQLSYKFNIYKSRYSSKNQLLLDSELYQEAQEFYSLQIKNKATFREAYLINKQIISQKKDIELSKSKYINDILCNHDNYDQYEWILLLWSFGSLDISHKELIANNVWPLLEDKLAAIKYENLLDISYLPTSIQHKYISHSNSTSLSYSPSLYILYLFEGLSSTSTYWRKLKYSLKSKLESCLLFVLEDIIHGNFELSSIFLYLSEIEVHFKELTSETKKKIRDAFYFLLNAKYSCNKPDFSLFIYSVANIDYKLVKIDSKLRSLITEVVVNKCSATPLRKHWKTIHGLGLIGLRWTQMDVNARYAIEEPLVQYGEVPSWKFTPTEICSVIKALCVIDARYSQLQGPTTAALMHALQKVVTRLRPKEISSLLSDLGVLEFEYQQMSDDLQSALVTAVQNTAARMSCWDIVETILGLAKLKMSSSFFQQCSLFYYLSAKSNLLGPSPVANLLLGMGLLRSDGVDVDKDMGALVQLLSRKWCGKMPSKEFMKACVGISLLAKTETAAFTPPRDLASISEPFLHDITKIGINNKNTRESPSSSSTENITVGKVIAGKISAELRSTLENMTRKAFVSLLFALARYGVTWCTLAKYKELQAYLDSRIVGILEETDTLPALHTVVAACASLQMKSTQISGTLYDSLAHSLDTFSEEEEEEEVSGSYSTYLDIVWCLGCMRVAVEVPETTLHDLVTSCSDIEFIELLYALGGVQWKWPYTGTSKSSDDLSAVMVERIEEALLLDNFSEVIIALDRVGLASLTSLEPLVAVFLPLVDSKAPLFAATLHALRNMALLDSLDPEIGSQLLTKVSNAVDACTESELSIILQSLQAIPTEIPLEKLYLGRRLFLNNFMKFKTEPGSVSGSGSSSGSGAFIPCVHALGELFYSESAQLDVSSEEDAEIVRTIVNLLEVNQLISLEHDFLLVLQSLQQLGIEWSALGSSFSKGLQESLNLQWTDLDIAVQEQFRSVIAELGAWDLTFPLSSVDSDAHFVSNWRTLEELRRAVSDVPTYLLPELLMQAAKLGFRVPQLQQGRVWEEYEPRIVKTEGRSSALRPTAVKVPLLLHALAKLGVKGDDLNTTTRNVITNVITTSLPTMPARSVSNTIFYAAKLRWVISEEVVQAARAAFFRTCMFMEGEGEFANALWAATHMSFTWVNLAEDEVALLARAFERLLCKFNARDLSTAVGALKTMRATWTTLPPRLGELLLERTADLVETLDGTSLALVLFSLGIMELRWGDLPIVVRAVVQERLPRHCTTFTEKESYWAVVGLGKLEVSTSSLTPEVLIALEGTISRCVGESKSLKPEGFTDILSATAVITGSWSRLSSRLQATLEQAIVSRVTSMSEKQVLEMLDALRLLRCRWSDLKTSTRMTILSRFSPLWLKKKDNGAVLLGTLEHMKTGMPNITEPFRNELLNSVLRTTRRAAVNETVTVFSKLARMGTDRSYFSSDHLVTINAILRNITSSSSYNNSSVSSGGSGFLLLNLLKDFQSMNIVWKDLDDRSHSLLSNLAFKYSSSSPSSSQNRDNSLLTVLTAMGAKVSTPPSQIVDIHKKVIPGSNVVHSKLIDSLTKRLPSLSDEDFLRVVYLLGQKRFPKDLLVSGGLLDLVDCRVHRMFPELSPGVIIAVLSSLRRIGIEKNLLPLVAADLAAQVSSLACTLDIRTFLLSVRSLSDLGFSWSDLTNDQKLGIAAGIARSATTNPSKLASILSVLFQFQATWVDLHERIPIVLRYVIFKIFSSIRPSAVLSEDERSQTIAYVENILKIFSDMKASWQLIGDKAGITILQAVSVLRLTREEEAVVMPLLSSIFSDIPQHVFEAVPIEFHFLFHLKDSRFLLK